MKRRSSEINFKKIFMPHSALKVPVLIFLLPLLLSAGCNSSKKEELTATAEQPAAAKGVQLETVKAESRAETIEVPGTVKARTTAAVAARIAGTVKQLRVREGDRVRRGDLLAVLDAQENLANAAVAKAAIDEALRGTEEAISRKKLVDSTFGRYQNLFNEQAISRQEFDTQISAKEVAEQGVARAEARLKQAKEASKSAGAVAGYTRITAPISGVVISKQIDLGASVFPGQPLLTIEDESSYQLELSVPESTITKITRGSEVQVTLDALKLDFNSKINEIVPATDPSSRTFIAKIALAQKGLKSGMFGRGNINLGTKEKGILLPKQALQERGALISVWVVDKDNQARMRLVKIGKVVGDKVEILSGISEGERVVVAGTAGVSEGRRVE